MAEASALLARSLSFPEAVQDLAELVVRFLADICLIDIVDEEGGVRRMAAVHAESDKQDLVRDLKERFGPDPSGQHPAVRVITTGRGEFRPSMPPEFLKETTRNGEHFELTQQLGFQSYLSVPLLARGHVLGALTLVSTDPDHRYDEADLALAEDLARRAALLFDNARLYEAERNTRLAAQRTAARISVLYSVTGALSEALTTDQVAGVVTERGLGVLGASAGCVALVNDDGTALEVVRTLGYSEQAMKGWARLPLEAPLPLTDAVKGNEPLFLRSPRERDTLYPDLAGSDLMSSQSWAAVPMTIKGRRIGAIGISFADPHDFTEEDRAFMVAMARQCALALDRTRLYGAERQARAEAEAAREKLAFLAAAGAELASSLDYEKTLARIAELAVPGLADLCVIDLLRADGSVDRLVTGRPGASEEETRLFDVIRRHPPDPRGPHPVAGVMKTGRPMVVHEVPESLIQEVARSGEHLRAMQKLRPESMLIVPLRGRHRMLGGLTFWSIWSGKRYGASDGELAEDLARRAAVALDNARLYREQRHIAEELQRSLLPAALPAVPSLDVAARYRAAGEGNEVGGDFYDLFRAGPNTWVAVVGDVCGKGAEAAAMTGLARYTLRAVSLHEHRPSEILRALNAAIHEQVADGRFCTVGLVSLRPGRSGARATISLGGHPVPMILRADGTVESAGTPGTLLGMFDEVDLADRGAALQPGDALILYTDGVTEEPTGQGLFGTDRLRATLASCQGLGAGEIAGSIVSAVESLHSQAPRDDLAVLVLRVRPL